MHGEFINVGKTVPVSAHHQMPYRLVVEISHEYLAVRSVSEAAEFFWIDAIAFAIRGNWRHWPLAHRSTNLSGPIGADFETEIAAPYVGRKAVIDDTPRQADRQSAV